MKVYLAGKMQGLPGYGFDLFDQGKAILEAAGYDVVSPADMDRDVGFDPTTPVTPEFVQDAMFRDIHEVLDCDAIALLPNWVDSGGAKCELDVARRTGKQVLHVNLDARSVAPEEDLRPSVVGLSGYAQSGKDTTAEILADYGYERIAFADALRSAVYALNPQLHDSIFETLQEAVDSRGWDWAKVNIPEVRRLLQAMGTEVGRQLFGSNVWVDIALRDLKPGGKYVITDMRFPNEFDAVRTLGGTTVRIQRDGYGAVNAHPSETSIDDFPFDVVIKNSGTLDDLRAAVTELL